MNPLIYQVIHLFAVMGLFAALGSIIAGTCASCKKSAAILHGVSILLLIVSGFGMIAKLGYSYSSGWLIGKIIIVFVLGGFLAVAKRKLLPPPVMMLIVLGLGATAAWLGVMKPF